MFVREKKFNVAVNSIILCVLFQVDLILRNLTRLFISDPSKNDVAGRSVATLLVL
jgi:hypothetical protein